METSVFSISRRHTLEELEAGGCKVRYSKEYCHFNTENNRSVSSVHLVKIPQWKKMRWEDCVSWAPVGYKALGLDALVALGVEYPDLQLTRVIVATGAADVPSAHSAIYHPFLSAQRGERIIGVPNWGVCWDGDNGQDGNESNFYGIFEKVWH